MNPEHLFRAFAEANAELRYAWSRLQFRSPPRSAMAAGSPLPGYEASAKRLVRILEHNILPFWYPGIVDAQNGGYLMHHCHRGQWLGPCPKGIVGQSRTLWFFSRLAARSPSADHYLEAAHWGFEFLRDRLWDDIHGGFFWEMDSAGTTPLKVHKHLYAQAFGLYALSAFAQASGSTEAKAMAMELVTLIENRARDVVFGGYREFLRRDWSAVPDDAADYRSGATPTRKTQDTHLHLLEAYTGYCQLTPDTVVKQRLFEIVFILVNTVQDTRAGVATDMHDASWRPLMTPAYAQVVYGHELEKIWLLTQASTVLDLAPALLIPLQRTWFSSAYDKAFDRRRGGFFDRGYVGQPAHIRTKTWWVQAEGLLAAMQMFVHTGEEHFYACFCRTLDWIESQQADWSNGDWHRAIAPTGAKYGAKVDNWKTPYHNGRAMIECLKLLQSELL